MTLPTAHSLAAAFVAEHLVDWIAPHGPVMVGDVRTTARGVLVLVLAKLIEDSGAEAYLDASEAEASELNRCDHAVQAAIHGVIGQKLIGGKGNSIALIVKELCREVVQLRAEKAQNPMDVFMAIAAANGDDPDPAHVARMREYLERVAK